MAEKISIGVLFGGRSGEHSVSLMSARFVLDQLDPQKYEITQIGITRQGEWLSGPNVHQAMLEADQANTDFSPDDLGQIDIVSLLPTPTRDGLYRLMRTQHGTHGEVIGLLSKLDVLFPVLHGTFGEDGTLQGLFEMADVAYVGCGVVGSAVAMDKAVFADIMKANNIPVVDTVLLLRSELEADMDAALDKAETIGDYPLFIKPANLGSSVGISKVKSRSDLLEGLMDAAQYDRRVVVQKGLDVREIEISVLGNDQPEASVCGEVLPGAEFYSYDAKYHDDRSQTVIPADIPDELAEQMRGYAVDAFKALDLAGLARVDFFLEKGTDRIYLNEINTMPGFTQISMYPMLWEASGISGPQLVDRLVELGLERKAQRDATTHQFHREAN
ncbi:MAG: D-alanine--D-alanine ligase [Chloroflexi bacterium]|nr:MAG: D-alanine--D-alanine ligase [Chloroflexota bacterium]MBL1195998.1 D-alanine--D-alanine ligase [Chloroflexota bacterium]NOH13292.1 D-alanine--D-alanine ligase [Chloroflexota bacterium]